MEQGAQLLITFGGRRCSVDMLRPNDRTHRRLAAHGDALDNADGEGELHDVPACHIAD